MNDQTNPNTYKEPDFKGEEMKLPEEKFGGTAIVEPEQKSGGPNMGPFILILTLILVLVLVGLYFWSKTFTDNTIITPPVRTSIIVTHLVHRRAPSTDFSTRIDIKRKNECSCAMTRLEAPGRRTKPPHSTF